MIFYFFRTSCAIMNALHLAIAHNQNDIAEILLKNGFNPNMRIICQCKHNCIHFKIASQIAHR